MPTVKFSIVSNSEHIFPICMRSIEFVRYQTPGTFTPQPDRLYDEIYNRADRTWIIDTQYGSPVTSKITRNSEFSVQLLYLINNAPTKHW